MFKILCEKPDYVQAHVTAGSLEFSAKRVAKNLFNTSNRFFQTVVKPRRNDLGIKEDIVIEDDFFIRRHDALLSEFRKLDFFEQEVIRSLLKHGSGKIVATITGLDYTYVKNKIKSGKRKLKHLINKQL